MAGGTFFPEAVDTAAAPAESAPLPTYYPLGPQGWTEEQAQNRGWRPGEDHRQPEGFGELNEMPALGEKSLFLLHHWILSPDWVPSVTSSSWTSTVLGISLHPRLGYPRCLPVFTWRTRAPPVVTPVSSVLQALGLWLDPSHPAYFSLLLFGTQRPPFLPSLPPGSASRTQCPIPCPLSHSSVPHSPPVRLLPPGTLPDPPLRCLQAHAASPQSLHRTVIHNYPWDL